MSEPKQVKIVLLTGYLGAGKTTILNHILSTLKVFTQQSLSTTLARLTLMLVLLKTAATLKKATLFL